MTFLKNANPSSYNQLFPPANRYVSVSRTYVQFPAWSWKPEYHQTHILSYKLWSFHTFHFSASPQRYLSAWDLFIPLSRAATMVNVQTASSRHRIQSSVQLGLSSHIHHLSEEFNTTVFIIHTAKEARAVLSFDALRSKPERCGFNSRWCHFNDIILSAALWLWGWLIF